MGPMEIKFLLSKLCATLVPLMWDREFFSEGSLGEEFGAYLYFWLDYDFSLDELIKVGEVDFRSWEI